MKFEQEFQHYGFRLTHLYEYEFPLGLTKIGLNLDNFDLPQRSYQYDFYIPFFRLKNAFSDNLKILFYSTKIFQTLSNQYRFL